MAIQFHSLNVKQIIKETEKTVSVVFAIPEALKESFKYKAGQYLTIRKTMNGEEVRRSYSISSAPSIDAEIQISSKQLEGGKMSTFLLRELKEGDTLEVMPPQGGFVVKDTKNPLVLFAAGSGITPIFSILKEALVSSKQLVHLFYGNRNEEEIIFKDVLAKLSEEYSGRFLVQHFLSSNGERLDLDRTQSLVKTLGAEANNAAYFICGPESMIQAVKLGLEKAAIPSSNVNIEYFASPKQEKQESNVVASGATEDMVVVIDDTEHAISVQDGEFILDAASRAGIDPPFSCQSGVCTTCKAKLLSGKVEMENNFGLGDDEINEGYVLTCIGKPITPGVKISWDEV